MSSRNPQSNHSSRSSRAPQSARANRAARAAQSGRISSRASAKSFAQQDGPSGNAGRGSQQVGGYRAAYSRDSQGSGANGAYSRQAPASGQYSRNNPEYSRKASKRMSRGKKVAIGALCTVLVLVLGAGTAFALYVNNLNNTLAGNKTDEEKMAIQDTLVATKNFTDPFYMMLIGSDARDDDEEMGQRSDTNILLRVDPTTYTVTMVSIPRDTMIDIDGYGTNKFNAAYNYGGAAATIREASQLCGVDISHYAEVNFEELVSLVDAVGGVEVDVPELIDDPDAGGFVIQQGVQNLNGGEALVFARSRAYADGDFTRTSNQRLLIEAIIKKVLSLPVTELPGVIQKAAECVTTDLSVNDILGLATQFKEFDKLVMYSAMVPSSTGYVGEISYVFADEVALKQMMQLVETGQDPSVVVSSGVVPQGATSSSSGSSGGGGYNTYSDTSGGGNSGGQEYYDPGYSDSGGGYVDPGNGGGGSGDFGGDGGDGGGSGDAGGGDVGGYSEAA